MKLIFYIVLVFSINVVFKHELDKNYHLAVVKESGRSYIRLVESKKIEGFRVNDEFVLVDGKYLRLQQNGKFLCESKDYPSVELCEEIKGAQKVSIVPNKKSVDLILANKCLTKHLKVVGSDEYLIILKACDVTDKNQLFRLYEVLEEATSEDSALEDSSSESLKISLPQKNQNIDLMNIASERKDNEMLKEISPVLSHLS
ncbi:hypothetical protein NGRA_0607 [Nosema granulosis]|uniref:Uncharacterized protein n=1 Tax=Nosema granulosis TaxID=83296 RepID=A0A9P6H388_9MICR|nr:hypothetical protein NGRA_0607 [Nosema granulosis]